jgi:hypothetical protein
VSSIREARADPAINILSAKKIGSPDRVLKPLILILISAIAAVFLCEQYMYYWLRLD